MSEEFETVAARYIEGLENELAKAKRVVERERREEALKALGIDGTSDTRAAFGQVALAIVELQNKAAANNETYETMTNGYTYLIPHRPMTDEEAGIGQ
jgi:hypothetical protein